jgi:peptidoglycan hydrolase-like protein with peptidoglycan-binding domain
MQYLTKHILSFVGVGITFFLLLPLSVAASPRAADVSTALTENSTPRFSATMAFKATGAEVLLLQDVLKEQNFFPKDIPSSGFFGPITKEAVLGFQRANGIPVLGIVGPLTRAALNATASVSGVMASGVNSVTVADRAEQILKLQEKISEIQNQININNGNLLVIGKLQMESGGGSFGKPNTAYFAQSFVSPGGSAETVKFWMRTKDIGISTLEDVRFRILLTDTSGSGKEQRPGAILFESPLITFPTDTEWRMLTVPLGNTETIQGGKYALVLDAFSDRTKSGDSGKGVIGLTANGYPSGELLFFNAQSGARSDHFAGRDGLFGDSWIHTATADLAFEITFAP